MLSKEFEVKKRKAIDYLFDETKKIIEYVREKKSKDVNDDVRGVIEKLITAYELFQGIPNSETAKNEILKKIVDFNALKDYDLTGNRQEDYPQFTDITIKRRSNRKPFRVGINYRPQPHKYRQWLIDRSHKAITENDVLSLLLHIIKQSGLDTSEYKKAIEQEYGRVIADKRPPYHVILIGDALLMPPFESLDVNNEHLYYDFGNGVNIMLNCARTIQTFFDESELITDHHKNIYSIINDTL